MNAQTGNLIWERAGRQQPCRDHHGQSRRRGQQVDRRRVLRRGGCRALRRPRFSFLSMLHVPRESARARSRHRRAVVGDLHDPVEHGPDPLDEPRLEQPVYHDELYERRFAERLRLLGRCGVGHACRRCCRGARLPRRREQLHGPGRPSRMCAGGAGQQHIGCQLRVTRRPLRLHTRARPQHRQRRLVLQGGRVGRLDRSAPSSRLARPGVRRHRAPTSTSAAPART